MNIALMIISSLSVPKSAVLTEVEKKRTLPIRSAMKRTFLTVACLGALAFLLPTACRRPHLRSQLENGLWASENGLWDEAIFRWKKFLINHPESVSARNNLAVAYEKKGMWDEAGREYEAALKIDPQNPSVKYNYDQFQKHINRGKKDDTQNKTESTKQAGDAEK